MVPSSVHAHKKRQKKKIDRSNGDASSFTSPRKPHISVYINISLRYKIHDKNQIQFRRIRLIHLLYLLCHYCACIKMTWGTGKQYIIYVYSISHVQRLFTPFTYGKCEFARVHVLIIHTHTIKIILYKGCNMYAFLFACLAWGIKTAISKSNAHNVMKVTQRWSRPFSEKRAI